MKTRHALLTTALAALLALPASAMADDAPRRGDRGARSHQKSAAPSRRFDNARATIRHRTVERASERDLRRNDRDRGHRPSAHHRDRRHDRHHDRRDRRPVLQTRVIIDTSPTIIYSRPRTVYCEPVVERRVVQRQVVAVDYSRDAWYDLERGHHRAALDMFGILASSNPDHALPKIGYALSAAGLHDDALAATALRRALTADAGQVYSFRASARLGSQLRDLERRYHRAVRANPYDTDAVFLLAGLRTLQGETITREDLDEGDFQMLATPDRELLGFVEDADVSMYLTAP